MTFNRNITLSFFYIICFLSCLLLIVISRKLPYTTILFLFSIIFISLAIPNFIKLLINIKLIFISILFSLIIIESYLLFFHDKKKIVGLELNDNLLTNREFYKDEEIGYKPIEGNYLHEIKNKDEIICSAIYTITKDRVRLTPNNTKDLNSKDLIIINFFGGSYVFGHCLNDNETVPYHLNSFRKNMYINNFAFQGYGVNHALYILSNMKNKTKDVKSINILLTAPWHNVRSLCLPDYSRGAPKYKINKSNTGVILTGRCQSLFDKFPKPLRKLIWAVLYRSKIKFLIQDYLIYTKNKYNMDLYIELISEMKNISDNRNMHFLVAYVIKQDLVNYPVETMKRGIDSVDITLAPSEELRDKKFFVHELDQHPSSTANYHTAKIIYDYIENNYF